MATAPLPAPTEHKQHAPTDHTSPQTLPCLPPSHHLYSVDGPELPSVHHTQHQPLHCDREPFLSPKLSLVFPTQPALSSLLCTDMPARAPYLHVCRWCTSPLDPGGACTTIVVHPPDVHVTLVLTMTDCGRASCCTSTSFCCWSWCSSPCLPRGSWGRSC